MTQAHDVLSSRLRTILNAELQAGNAIEGQYVSKFRDCRLLVVLTRPFIVRHAASVDAIEAFANRDSHYPLGDGFKDPKTTEIVLAPFA
jgi:hypothetical protein